MEILDILLESDNENIIEYAAILIDNWHETSFIPKLKQSLEKIESDWLKSFIERVLQNLLGKSDDDFRHLRYITDLNHQETSSSYLHP